METQCVPCGKVLSGPTAAAKHVLKHDPVRRSGKSRWGEGAYEDGERWDVYSSRTNPPAHAQIGSGEGPDSPVSDADVLGHTALRPSETPCICGDHYPVIPSWQMAASGQGIGAHRHKDIDNRCVTCGGEKDPH